MPVTRLERLANSDRPSPGYFYTNIVVEDVRKIADQVGFVVLPRRWLVERFFAWINRNRRLTKDFMRGCTAWLSITSARIRR